MFERCTESGPGIQVLTELGKLAVNGKGLDVLGQFPPGLDASHSFSPQFSFSWVFIFKNLEPDSPLAYLLSIPVNSNSQNVLSSFVYLCL